MKVTVKSITEVHAKNANGEVRTQPDEHGERVPMVERVVVELVDAAGQPVATHILGPDEKHGLEVGKEYEKVLGHTYEHAKAEAAAE